MPGEDDVVAVPTWTFGLRIAQIFPAIIVLGLNGFGVSFYSYNVLIFSIVNVCPTRTYHASFSHIAHSPLLDASSNNVFSSF